MPHAAAISGRTVIIHVLTVVLASAALCSAGAQDAPARPPLVGAEWVHVAVAGESWTTIGAREGITPAVLADRNAAMGTRRAPEASSASTATRSGIASRNSGSHRSKKPTKLV